MSLAALVEFAQRNFGVLTENLPIGDTEARTTDPADQGVNTLRPPLRPGLPVWLRQRTPEREMPASPDFPWRIEGDIGVQNDMAEVDTLGPDALAFYVPFHFYRCGWGIFIRMSGAVHLAKVLKGSRLRPGDEDFLDLAESILVEHEWHHAATEIASTRMELFARRAIYRPYFYSTSGAAPLEEALANAQAFSRVFEGGDPWGARLRAENWMSRQGEGYRDYARWLKSRKFSAGLDQAARFMTEVLPDPKPRADTSLHTFLYRGAGGYRSMPLVRVNDLGAIGVTVLRPFPKAYGLQVLVHSNDHPPPHIHVQILSGGGDVRYSWPDLVPLKGERPITNRDQRGLRRYIEVHGTEIGDRVKAVYGSV